MIDELEILKTILENLSAVGIKGVLAYIAYKVLIAGFWLGGIIYIFKSMLGFFLNYQRSQLEKGESDSYELKEAKRALERIKHENEDIKHCYKILKEKCKDE